MTLVGVAIAVPAIAFNTYFRNRITQLMLEVGSTADDLLDADVPQLEESQRQRRRRPLPRFRRRE